MTMLAPACASASTIDLPIPVLPPVTIATLPSSVMAPLAPVTSRSDSDHHALGGRAHHPERVNLSYWRMFTARAMTRLRIRIEIIDWIAMAPFAHHASGMA